MPLFRFRLEATDGAKTAAGTPHYREGTTEAATKEEARLWLEQCERDYAAFQSPDIDDLTERESLAQAAGAILPPKERAHLAIHRQTKPYKLVSLEEVKA